MVCYKPICIQLSLKNVFNAFRGLATICGVRFCQILHRLSPATIYAAATICGAKKGLPKRFFMCSQTFKGSITNLKGSKVALLALFRTFYRYFTGSKYWGQVKNPLRTLFSKSALIKLEHKIRALVSLMPY